MSPNGSFWKGFGTIRGNIIFTSKFIILVRSLTYLYIFLKLYYWVLFLFCFTHI